MGAVKNHFFDEINARDDEGPDEPPAFTTGRTFDGRPAIFHRGVFLRPEVAERLLPVLIEDRSLQHRAAELKAAMLITGAMQ